MVLKPALRVENINYHIEKHHILSGVSFDVAQGQIFGLLGPNGAGKSSLLNAISGLTDFDGDVFWRDESLRRLSAQQRAKQLAVVHQTNAPIFALTTEQVVAMGLLPHKSLLSRHSRHDKKSVSQALDYVGLQHKRTQAFSALSGGEQQRCLIGRALVQQASLLVLDEPVNHLDVYYQHQILGLLKTLAKTQGKTIVISLHDLNLASKYCDTIGVLQRGQLRAIGAPETEITHELIQHVFSVDSDIRTSTKDGRIKVDLYPNVEGHSSSRSEDVLL